LVHKLEKEIQELEAKQVELTAELEKPETYEKPGRGTRRSIANSRTSRNGSRRRRLNGGRRNQAGSNALSNHESAALCHRGRRRGGIFCRHHLRRGATRRGNFIFEKSSQFLSKVKISAADAAT